VQVIDSGWIPELMCSHTAGLEREGAGTDLIAEFRIKWLPWKYLII